MTLAFGKESHMKTASYHTVTTIQYSLERVVHKDWPGMMGLPADDVNWH